MARLATLRRPIDAFFDKVTVNARELGVALQPFTLVIKNTV